MKIIREGKEFELTAEELLEAYIEQEAIWDRSNITQNMENYLSRHEYLALSQNEEFIVCAASKLREKEDSGLSYEDALKSAIKETKEGFRQQIDSFVDMDTIDTSDRAGVEKAVYDLLDRATIEQSRDLDVDSPYYKNALELLEDFCYCNFRELYGAIFGSDNDLFFKDGEKFDYNLFYYNPDSNACGQIVQCPFSVEQARRMLGNPDYMDVLAENTQYLSDINNLVFFDSVFELFDLKEDGRFLGVSVDAVCEKIVAPARGDVPKPTLADQIAGADLRRSGSFAEKTPQSQDNIAR